MSRKSRISGILFALLLALLLLTACQSDTEAPLDVEPPSDTQIAEAPDEPSDDEGSPDSAPDSASWQEAIAIAIAAQDPSVKGKPGPGLAWYQVFVYSFYDSDGDGIGDLNGVTLSLDYIQSMGFDGIWLSPIHPSSTYHKYNVRDYYDIDPEYGTMEDFDALIKAADERGINIILDLVINHTDLHHPWFTERPEFYNISDDKGHGNWYQLPDGKWYEAQFWSEMPDLDLLNEELRAELEKMFEFWLGRGVAGFRLDAVKDYTGSTPANIEILSWINEAVKRIKPDAYLVGEVWDTTTSLYQNYESGVDSFFSFPFAGARGLIAETVLNQDAPIFDYLDSTQNAYNSAKSFNPDATNAPFFTNHDMARAAGFLKRDPNLIKTAWGLSIMQPGDAFVYYGEELGMSGTGRDENFRAPMLWVDDEYAGGSVDISVGRPAGMTVGPPEMEEQNHSFPPAVLQIADPDSIYSYIRDAIRLRREYPQIGRGSFEPLPMNAGIRVGAARRSWEDADIIMVYNISEEAASFSLPGELIDWLSATGEQPEQEGNQITIPGYTIVILVI